MKTPELEKEFELLKRAKVQVESDKPLREMTMTAEDKKRIKGFMFLVRNRFSTCSTSGSQPSWARNWKKQ